MSSNIMQVKSGNKLWHFISKQYDLLSVIIVLFNVVIKLSNEFILSKTKAQNTEMG